MTETKGWSVSNYLVLKTQALTGNPNTKFLAQRDNQIVITQYSLVPKGSRDITIIRKNIWLSSLANIDNFKKL